MSQFPTDEPPSISYNDQLDVTDCDDARASCLLDGSDWIALGDNGNMALSLHAGIQDYQGHIGGPQHDSIGDEWTYSPCEGGFAPNIADSWEMEIDVPINNHDDIINSFEGAQFSEASRQYAITHGRIDPASSWPISPIEDLMDFDRAHPGPRHDSPIMPAIPQHSFESPHGILVDPNHDQLFGVSSFTTSGHMNSQHFNIPPAVSTYAHGPSEAQQLALDSSRNPFDLYPYVASTSCDFIHAQEPWPNSRTANWADPIGTYTHETFTGQNQSTHNFHPQLTSLSPFTDSQLSGVIVDEREDFSLPSWVGVNLARTNSLENTAVMYHGALFSAEHNIASSHIPAPDLHLNRLHQDDVSMSSAGIEPPSTNFPSQSQSNRRPSVTARGVSNTRSTRFQSDKQKEVAYQIRDKRCACVHSKLTKRAASISVPCKWCQKIIGQLSNLAPAICYKRNFQQVFGTYSDFFGIVVRWKSIESVLESRHGQEHDFLLGCGLRENSSEISIDIDTSSIRPVKTQRIAPMLWQHTISTHDSNLTASMAALETSHQALYVFVPDSLPHIDDLDAWGREDILELARKWPDNLAAAYDRAFLEYLKHYKLLRPKGPQPHCFKIVEATMRIVSLGKNLDSRRPIDHKKSMEMITNLARPQVGIEDPRFGIEEFNEWKTRLQLSSLAKIQLYLHAARGIEETQRSLGMKIDELFEQNDKNTKREDILLVGACLHRLSLDYRQRRQRYREFVAGTVDDRIERCSFMYIFFTRLYELWFRRPAKNSDTKEVHSGPKEVFPMSSNWNAEDFSESVRGNAELVQALSKLNGLEKDFCVARLNDPNEDESMYKKLIVERVFPKARKAHTWSAYSTTQPSTTSSFGSKGKAKSW